MSKDRTTLSAAGPKRGIVGQFLHDWQLWLMLLPAIVYIFIFCYMPMYGVQLAFRKYDFAKGIYGGEWMGLTYFKQYFVWMYVFSGVWQGMGWNSIIYLAALSGVDPSLHEAAKIDGANALQRVIHVEFPALVPTIMILLIMNMGSILNVGFDKIFLMQNTLNKGVSEVISTYVYHLMAPTTGSPQFSLATAVGLFTNVVNFGFLMIANWISKKITGSGLM